MTLQNASLQREEGKRCRAALSEPIPRLHPGITQIRGRGPRQGGGVLSCGRAGGKVCVTGANEGLGREQPVGKWLLISLGTVLLAQYL